ncbi:MAG TPA: hypothetical protein VGG74_09200 [Kofleriaceae bacterium]|jgi:hypothetical protein
MKTLTFVSVSLALALAGCGSKGGSTAACSAAADKGVSTMLTMVKSRMEQTGATPEQMTQVTEAIGKLKDVIVKHCVDDKWSKDVIDCYANASSQPEFKACREKLPQDQAQKLQTDEMGVMSSMMRGMRGHGMGMHMGGGSGGTMMAPPGGSGMAAPTGTMGSATMGSAAPAPAPAAHAGSAAK